MRDAETHMIEMHKDFNYDQRVQGKREKGRIYGEKMKKLTNNHKQIKMAMESLPTQNKIFSIKK